MAEACTYMDTANKDTEMQQKPEEIIEMNTSKSTIKGFKAERVRSNESEAVIANSCRGKTFFNILCVGDYSGGWSKQVYIEDYMSSDKTIRKKPCNRFAIAPNYFAKCLHDKLGEEIRIHIWYFPEHEASFAESKILYPHSDGAIVFWGPRNHTKERALIYKHEITQIKPDIPFVLVVDNVFQTPKKWIGQGLAMNSLEEMDSFCLEHEFFAWFEMLERAGGEKSIFGQAMTTLINEIIYRNKSTENV